MSKNLDNNQNASACVYYRDDFDFLMRMLNSEGNDIGWPDFDWHVRLWTATKWRSYEAGVKDGVPYNCYNDNGRIHIVCDNHGLTAGKLHIDLACDIPNAIYSDGKQYTAVPVVSDITLTRDAADRLPSGAEVEITARTLATAISLGRGDSPDNYREITAAEADTLRAEQIAAFDRIAAERRARIEAAANNPDMQP